MNTLATPEPAGLPPFRAIPDVMREHAQARPQQLALSQGMRSLSWGELDAVMDRVAATLQHAGVQPRQSIAICGANSIEYAVAFLGALRAGVAVAPLPTGALPEQLAGMVRDSGARFIFADAGVPAFASEAPRIALEQLAEWLLPASAR